MKNEVDELKEKYDTLEKLLETENIQLLNYFSGLMAKTGVIASAGFFETKIIEFFIRKVKEASSNDLMKTFLEKLLIKREYSKWFNWNDKNEIAGVYSFLGNFGKEFTTEIRADMKDRVVEFDNEKITLVDAGAYFIKMGRRRNEVVHKGLLGNFDLDDITFKEIYIQHKFVELFWDYIFNKINNYKKNSSNI